MDIQVLGTNRGIVNSVTITHGERSSCHIAHEVVVRGRDRQQTYMYQQRIDSDPEYVPISIQCEILRPLDDNSKSLQRPDADMVCI